MAPPPATVGATAARGPVWPPTPGNPAPGPRPGPDVRPAMRPRLLLPVVALLPATAAPSPLLDATWLNAILECSFWRLCQNWFVPEHAHPIPGTNAVTPESIRGATQMIGLQGHR